MCAMDSQSLLGTNRLGSLYSMMQGKKPDTLPLRRVRCLLSVALICWIYVILYVLSHNIDLSDHAIKIMYYHVCDLTLRS
jgi:hypothetical protein